MKKNFCWLALAAVALLSSCSQEEFSPVQEDENVKEVINFSVYTTGKTRATSYNLNDLKASGFHISGYVFMYDDPEDDLQFQNKMVWNNGNWETADGEHYYWVDSKIMFFYAHKDVTGLTASTVDGKDDYRYLKYVAPANPDDQQDLLLAYAAQRYQEGNPAVELKFKHALSWITFKWSNTGSVDTDHMTYNLKSLKLTCRTTGDLNMRKLDAANNNQVVQGIFWENVDTPVEMVLYDAANGVTGTHVADGDPTTLVTVDRDLMIIPGPGVYLTAVYDVLQNGTVTLENKTTGFVMYGEKVDNQDVFVMGKHYTYNLIPTNPNSDKTINFSVSVEEWEDYTPGNDIPLN